MPPLITVLQPGDTTKPNPYTIAIVANPALETASGSGAFVPDPILGNLPGFDAAAQYVFDVLFGRLPAQAERLLADPSFGPHIRVVKVFDSGRPPTDPNALVTQFAPNIAEPRRDQFKPFLAAYQITADVAYAVTASPTHDRASAWFTTDDTSRGGIPFNVDGTAFTHWYFCTIPGTVALPVSSNSMTALHEFGHAGSSFSDGMVIDQYVDNTVGLNNKRGRPIPATFGTLDGAPFNTDPTRDGLGYPPSWQSYHPELMDPAMPSLMDNYWLAPGGVPEKCRWDGLTRQYFFDRLTAKLSRP